jgi:hypothetical protein
MQVVSSMNTFQIDLSKLKVPRDVCSVMERSLTKNYVYFFEANQQIFNIGKAADKEWEFGTWGNRMYRKAGGIPGWKYLLNDTSAAKMTQLMKTYLPEVSKDQVIITINDYTQLLVDETDKEVDRFLLNEENKLVRQYEKAYGCLPPLNIQNTRAHPVPLFDMFYEE